MSVPGIVRTFMYIVPFNPHSALRTRHPLFSPNKGGPCMVVGAGPHLCIYHGLITVSQLQPEAEIKV